jgi:preprotein translocase subunit Sss1
MTQAPGPLWKRLGWFVGLWAAGVAAVGAVAYLIRLIIL